MSKGNSPAFPCQDNKKNIYTGMNLRDYISMEALHALIDSGNWTGSPRAIAEEAYKIADAMLEERLKYK